MGASGKWIRTLAESERPPGGARKGPSKWRRPAELVLAAGDQAPPSEAPFEASSPADAINSSVVASVVRAPPGDFRIIRQEWAAIRIQSAFRAFLIRHCSIPPIRVKHCRIARLVRPQMAGPAAGPSGRSEPGHHDAPMLLRIHVIEVRGLPAIYLNGSSDPYVRLQLGRRRPRSTMVVKRSLSTMWDEEFGFLMGDVAEELVISVLNEDYFFGIEFLGRVRVPLTAIMETNDLSLGTKWYQLLPSSGGKFRR